MTQRARRLLAQYVLRGREVITRGFVDVDLDGRISAIGAACDAPPLGDDADAEDLGQVALVPGLINAHSHVFQRALRGRTEHLSEGHEADDFWSWRALMYEAAGGLDPERMREVARTTYAQMRRSGITTVGEFHYVQHQPDGTPYDAPDAMADAVIEAAREVGLRITLLRVAYYQAGFGQAPSSGQRRFVDASVEATLTRVDALRARWAHDPGVVIGLAPHSVRAVPPDALVTLADYARAHKLPFHLHACEQRAEIAQCIAAHGCTPIGLLDRLGLWDVRPVLVHATHLSAHDLELMARHRPMVCACPSTERNLGDGFLPALALMRARVPICLGSDSHADIDLWEEQRLVEYHERLRYERRNVLAEVYDLWLSRAQGAPRQVADLLWPMATAHGADALGVDAGAIEIGRWADLVAVELSHDSVAGCDAASLVTSLSFSLKPGAVRQRWVAGQSD